MTGIPDLTLPGETSVVIAGDWHGSVNWVQATFPFLRRATPNVRTVLHVGDFGHWPDRPGQGFVQTVDYWMRAAGVERILVTPGNHEWWSDLDSRFAAAPGQMVQLTERVFVAPRGYRFTIAGRQFTSFGGAASLDKADRTPLRDWWPTEIPTDEDVARAIAGGPTDVLLTHETVDDGAPLVESVLRSNPLGWGPEELAYSALSRRRVSEVYRALHPDVLVHGHIHLKDEWQYANGQRIYSMGADGDPGNLGLLTLPDLRWTWLGDPRAWKR